MFQERLTAKWFLTEERQGRLERHAERNAVLVAHALGHTAVLSLVHTQA